MLTAGLLALAVLLLAYVAGYWGLLFALSLAGTFRKRADAPPLADGGAVTVLVPAHFEGEAVSDTVRTLLDQDYPGRVGFWSIGVPPSGPMDDLAFRLANRAVGNPEDAAGLELAVTGPTLRFNSDSVIALAGARMRATLDDAPVNPEVSGGALFDHLHNGDILPSNQATTSALSPAWQRRTKRTLKGADITG